jgi:hypothetical protein
LRYFSFIFALLTLVASTTPSSADQLVSKGILLNNVWKEYCTQFQDPDTNNKYSACPDPTAPGKTVNGDIDIEGTLFKDTLNLEDPDTYAAVQAILRNLLQPSAELKVPDNVLNTPTAHKRIMMEQHISSARTIVYKVLSDIVSRRQSIPPSTVEQLVAAGISSNISSANTTSASGGSGGSSGGGNSGGSSGGSSSGGSCGGGSSGSPPPPTANAPACTKFGFVLGDSIANGTMHAGHIKGSSCPDNGHTHQTNPDLCPNGSFFQCNPARNSTGSTCVSRTPTNILKSIIPLYKSEVSGQNIVLSSGLSNDTSKCVNGASQTLHDQLVALKANGAAHIVVLSTSLNPKRKDLNVLNDCVVNEVKNLGDPTITYIPGFANTTEDRIHPADYVGFYAQALQALQNIACTPVADASVSSSSGGSSGSSSGSGCSSSGSSSGGASSGAPTLPPPEAGTPGGLTPTPDASACAVDQKSIVPGSKEAFMIALAQSESGGVFNIRTNLTQGKWPNYLGAWQMGEGALVGEKCVVPDCQTQNNNYGADPAPGSVCTGLYNAAYAKRSAAQKTGAPKGITAEMVHAEKWVGTCGGVEGINSSEDYLNCPRAQLNAASHFDLKGGVPLACHAICDVVDGVTITPSGLRAAAHLLGSGGTKEWLCGQHKNNVYDNAGKPCTDPEAKCPGSIPRDAGDRGTKITTYVSRFGGFNTDGTTCGASPRATGTLKFRPPGSPPPPGVPGGKGDVTNRNAPGTNGAPPNPDEPLGPPKLVSEVVHEIRKKAGVDPEKIADDPSYNEIMLAMTKEKFFDPSYYANLAGDPSALKQEQVMLDSYVNVQLHDVYTLQEQINALLAARASLDFNKDKRPTHIEAAPVK